MDNKNNERQLAKDLYLHTDKTQSEIADILDVNRKTLYLWIRNGKWEEMKIAARQAPGIILQDIYNHIDEINKKVRNRTEDRCPTMEEVEKLRKLLRMTTLVNKKNTGTYIEVIEELTMFIARKDIDLAHQVTKMADSYIKGSILNKNFNLDQNVADIASALAQDNEADCQLPLPTAPEVTNGAQWGNDEASPEPEGIAPEPVTINKVKEDIHNDADPILPQEKNEENEVIPSRHDYWTQYLEQRFQISKDPYVTRKNGITIIRSQSPLCGRTGGLFF